MLTEACRDTGVELGPTMPEFLDWIAGFEDSTCAVIVGLIHRARQAGIAASPAAVVLDAAQLGTVLGTLADAAEYRRKEAGQWCADCAASPPEACEEHLDELDAAQIYDELARRLGEAADA